MYVDEKQSYLFFSHAVATKQLLLKIQFLILLFFQMNGTPTPINDMALLVKEYCRLDASSMLLLEFFFWLYFPMFCVYSFFLFLTICVGCFCEWQDKSLNRILSSNKKNQWLFSLSLSLPLQFFLQKMSPFSSSVHFVRFHIKHLRIYERF